MRTKITQQDIEEALAHRRKLEDTAYMDADILDRLNDTKADLEVIIQNYTTEPRVSLYDRVRRVQEALGILCQDMFILELEKVTKKG